MPLIFCNGAPASAQQLGAAALINYGHFTTLQVRDGATLGLDLHLQRLQEGSRALFGQELEAGQLRAQMRAALLASGMADASLRVTVFAPDYDFRNPLREVALDVLVAISPPADMPETGLRVQVTDYVRERPELKHVGTFRSCICAGWPCRPTTTMWCCRTGRAGCWRAHSGIWVCGSAVGWSGRRGRHCWGPGSSCCSPG